MRQICEKRKVIELSWGTGSKRERFILGDTRASYTSQDFLWVRPSDGRLTMCGGHIFRTQFPDTGLGYSHEASSEGQGLARCIVVLRTGFLGKRQKM